MLKKIKEWYDGKLHPVESDGEMIGITHKTSLSACLAKCLIGFWLRNWKWILGFILALAGLYLNIISIRGDS